MLYGPAIGQLDCRKAGLYQLPLIIENIRPSCKRSINPIHCNLYPKAWFSKVVKIADCILRRRDYVKDDCLTGKLLFHLWSAIFTTYEKQAL